MKRTTVAVTAALALTIAGCKMNVTPELYLSDLRAVIEDGTYGMTTPTAIAVEIPSTEECGEYTAKIRDVLTGILESYEARGCTSEGMDSWLNLEAKVPIMHGLELGQKGLDNGSLPLFSVFVSPILEGRFEGLVAICLHVNREKYRLLNERMSDLFYQKIDLAASAVGMLLNNDERKPASYSVGGSFLNGVPVFKWQQFSLERRDSADLALSNVGAAALEAEGGVCPLALDLRNQ